MGIIGCILVLLGSPLDENYMTKQIYRVAVLMGKEYSKNLSLDFALL